MIQIFALWLGLEEIALDDMFIKKPLTDITTQHYPVQAGKTGPEETMHSHAENGGESPLLGVGSIH